MSPVWSQPSVEHLARGLLVPVVAREDGRRGRGSRRPRRLPPRSPCRLADRAEAEASRHVHVRRRRALGQAVALEDDDADREEELGDSSRAARRPRSTAASARRAALDLGEDELVGERVLERRGRRDRLAPPARSSLTRLPTLSAQSMSLRLTPVASSNCLDGRVHLLEHARDARQHRRLHPAATSATRCGSGQNAIVHPT